jgi:Peptidase inhibitor family I36
MPKNRSLLLILTVCSSFLVTGTQSSAATTGVTFYQDVNYGGTAITLGAGNYTMTQLNAAGIPNDWMSSLKVPSGYTVEVFQDDNFAGTEWIYCRSIAG